MIFVIERQIRFHHCDPAGIVFYPQFFYLLHEAKEDFLIHIGFPQHEMIRSGFGTPIVDVKTSFLGMCRYGDEISISVSISKLGNSSLGMDYEIHSGGQPRDAAGALKLKASSVLVYSGLTDGKPLRIPDALRAAMAPYLQQLQPHPQET
ncbi:MAG: thioesterase family protein [Pseudomonadota bacterium]